MLTVPATDTKIVSELQAANVNGPLSTSIFDGRSGLLPKGITEDVLLNEPPFTFTLDDSEIQELSTECDKASRILAVAATSYGPPPPAQEKISNEDFALSAIIRKSDGEEWAFAAVADGVSTRTFWAARTSRIACLVAFKVFRQFIDLGRNVFDDAILEDLQETLAGNLRDELRRDKLSLLEYRDVVPENWSAEMYENYKERDELWYNSTLLVTCLGPQAGLLIYAGDGGIELIKLAKAGKAKLGRIEVTEVLRSTEDLTIQNFVSLGVTSKDFRAARISYDRDVMGVEVILSSDGVDRTVQMNSAEVTYQHLDLDSSILATKQLKALLKLPNFEADNFSVARAARYKDKIRKIPPLKSPLDKTRPSAAAIPPGSERYPKLQTPPVKRKIDRYMILPFIVGGCVGVGSTLGAMYLRGSRSSSTIKTTPSTEAQKSDSPSPSAAENSADKPPNTTSNVNSRNSQEVPETAHRRNSKSTTARRAAQRKQADASKPSERPTETKPPGSNPTVKPSPAKPQTSPRPKGE